MKRHKEKMVAQLKYAYPRIRRHIYAGVLLAAFFLIANNQIPQMSITDERTNCGIVT